MAKATISVKADRSDEAIREAHDAIMRALTIIGGKVKTYSSGMAPVKTGNLRRSMNYKVVDSESAVYVGTNVEYGKYQEMGTSRMRAANGGRGFLRPAVEDHIDEYREIILGELKS